MPVLGEMLPQVSVDLFTPCPVQMEYPNGDLHRLSNGCIYPRASARHTQCLAPVSLTGLISLILSILCAALNLVRGAHVVEHATQVGLWTWISLVTEISRWFDDQEWKLVASVFFITCGACFVQCYMFLLPCYGRLAVSGVVSIAICISNLYLLGHRNIWQLLFHTAVAFLSTVQTYCRPTQHSVPLPCV
uniref:vesicle-trafficking protein SEC22c-like isoform X2 n=1 Tax=Myxine glutinosa TaxID=7769 RepID=UPI00358E9011